MSSSPVPVIVNGIFTFLEWASLKVAVSVLVVPFSKITSLSNSILFTLGLSSLRRFKVTSVSLEVTLTNVPKVKIMVSKASTAVSSNPLVDIVNVPVVDPAAIDIGLDETVNSVVSVAVPPTVYGIWIDFPLTLLRVAVKVTSVDEFSSILGKLKAKDTDGGSSLSVIVTVDAEDIELVAFVGDVLGVIIIVSSSSSSKSLSEVKIAVPVVAPAAIVISGLTCNFKTLWLFASAT